jgi:penicillin amidase
MLCMGMRRERGVVGYGKLYKHQAGVNPNFILTALVVKRIKNFDFSKNPSAVNQNGIMSTRKQSTRASRWVFPYYLPEDRAKRITQLLEPKSNWDKAAGQMIYDNTSSVAPEVVKQLISNLSQQALSSNEKELAVLKMERL